MPRVSAARDELCEALEEPGRFTANELLIAHLAVETFGYAERVDRKLRRAAITNYALYAMSFAVLCIAGYAVSQVRGVADTNMRLLKQQASQVDANERLLKVQADAALARCATISAVTQAGRNAIRADGDFPSEYSRNIERLGAPSAAQRRKEAIKKADNYSMFIAREVERISGRSFLVKKDGSLDCKKLAPAPKP